MLKYLQQRSELTLLEGIQELRKFEGNTDNDMVQTATDEFIAKLEGHDVIHCLFGCSTDVLGEIKVHLWMVFGTNTKIAEIKSVLGSRDHQDTLKDIGHRILLKRWLYALPLAVKIFIRSRKMSKKYAIENFQTDLHQPLFLLRSRYGIHIV